MHLVGSSPDRHAGLQDGSCAILSLGIRGSESVIPVVGRPIEFVVAVAFVDGVLRLISRGVDECERLAHNRLLPVYRTYPEDWLPGLRSGTEGTGNGGCILSVREPHGSGHRATPQCQAPTEVYHFAVEISGIEGNFTFPVLAKLVQISTLPNRPKVASVDKRLAASLTSGHDSSTVKLD
jgi:hypothetical protein